MQQKIKLEFSAQTKAFSWEKVGRRKPSRMRVNQEVRYGECPYHRFWFYPHQSPPCGGDSFPQGKP